MDLHFQKLATLFFAVAIIHGFLSPLIGRIEKRYPKGSLPNRLFYLLSEIEVPFGLWAALFAVTLFFTAGHPVELEWIEGTDFTEAIFVFVILLSASTAPILGLTSRVIRKVAALIPIPREFALFFSAMTIGPLSGSLITEPAAMTVTASFLLSHFFSRPSPVWYRYGLLALLLINVSIGGALTHFSAPPILMVAGKWGWSTAFVFQTLGEKVLLAMALNLGAFFLVFRKEIKTYTDTHSTGTEKVLAPAWVTIVHLVWLVLVVLNAHHAKVLLAMLPFFLGFYYMTKSYQQPLKTKESLLVAFFLGGLVLFGRLQTWWLEPLLTSLEAGKLFVGAIGLTAIMDNAALTYLGSQVPHLTDATKYFLVSGALVGGGLTLIANAPNPIAASLLHEPFEKEGGINALRLFLMALPLTALTAVVFWFLA